MSKIMISLIMILSNLIKSLSNLGIKSKYYRFLLVLFLLTQILGLQHANIRSLFHFTLVYCGKLVSENKNYNPKSSFRYNVRELHV